jgi:hypothetical protein
MHFSLITLGSLRFHMVVHEIRVGVNWSYFSDHFNKSLHLFLKPMRIFLFLPPVQSIIPGLFLRLM